MAARSRPRISQGKEDELREERNVWNHVVSDFARLKALYTRASEVSTSIVEAEERLSISDDYTVQDVEALEQFYRDAVRLAEDEQKILGSRDKGVIHDAEILHALRDASEVEAPRLGSNVKSRNQKRKLDSEGGGDSPGPSPGGSAAHGKLKISGRSGSVSSVGKDTKEKEIKSEEIASTTPVDALRGLPADKSALLIKGAEVAYKQNKQKGMEGEWIQCTIIGTTGEGKHKRFEVQDPEPDENGAPGQVYRTSASALIPIPPRGTSLPDYPKGKQVMACYPQTTTFYRAEVMGMKRGECRLRFDGEDEIGKETDVDRRYVLDVGNR